MNKKVISILTSLIVFVTFCIGVRAADLTHVQKNNGDLTLTGFAQLCNMQPSTSAEEWISSKTAEVSYPSHYSGIK